jgi:serine/threonine protein kinase/tetratricopeptide (TPR) repeat protein
MLGTTISHYRVLDRLGSGGMGVVYRAEDTRLGREVALKCLPPEVAGDPQMVERLVREARSASSLNHPNICTIHEVDQADGHHFITMELLEGQTLRERIGEGPIPAEELHRIGVQVADALDSAHKKGIIHRDIKPANVFLTSRGEAKVLDFGLAKLETPKLVATAAGITAAPGGKAELLTSPGQTVGTIAYMSPEQARGQKLDVRSDLFSLGVVLYEAAAGELPFPGGTTALIFDAILNREPVPLSRHNTSLPDAFANVVTKLLEKDCRLRYQSASDVVADLHRLHGGGVSIKPARAISPTVRRVGKIVDSLAVLPFANETRNPELDYLGDAIAEGLIDELSNLPKLRVVPRRKAFRHRDHADDLRLVARELEVRAVLSGRITLRSDLLSIRAEMIDVAKDTQLWGSEFSCTASEVLDVQEEIGRRVAERLRAPSSVGSKKATAKSSPTPVRNEADELFLRGNDQAIQWTPDGLQRGIELYRQAIDADPRYAPAYACMAIAHTMLTVVGRVDTAQAFGEAKACARRAIELDEALSEAHAALCLTEVFSDFNLAEALWQGERALELNPDSAIARYACAQTLAACGRLDEAIEQAREGCAIDPLMAPINYCYGLLLYYQRRWDEADAQLQRTLEIHPDFVMAGAVRGIVVARVGRFSEARAQLSELLNRDRDPVWELLLAYIDALAGEREQAVSILAQVDCAAVADGAYFAATIYGALGELDRGFAELERARDVGFAVLAPAAVNPALDPFRSDPRWEPFLRSIEELAHAIQELQGTE